MLPRMWESHQRHRWNISPCASWYKWFSSTATAESPWSRHSVPPVKLLRDQLCCFELLQLYGWRSQRGSNACKRSNVLPFNKHLVKYLLCITEDPRRTAQETQILRCVESSQTLRQFKVKIKTIHYCSVWSRKRHPFSLNVFLLAAWDRPCAFCGGSAPPGGESCSRASVLDTTERFLPPACHVPTGQRGMWR